jgi:hypothetical protein
VFFFYGSGPLARTPDGEEEADFVCETGCIVGFSIGGAAILLCIAFNCWLFWPCGCLSCLACGLCSRKKTPKKVKELAPQMEAGNLPAYNAIAVGSHAQPMRTGAHNEPTAPNAFGLYQDASEESYQAAVAFVRDNPVAPPPPDTTLPAWYNYSFAQVEPGFFKALGIAVTNAGLTMAFKKKKDSTIQAIHSVPLYAPPGTVFYFEVTIKKKDPNTVVAIGLASRPYPSFRLPGWEPISIGYHSDDGRKFISDPDGGRDYAQPYAQGDTIGVGYRPHDGLVFFTRNGYDLGVAGMGVGVGEGLYPAIGMDGKGEVEVDFSGTSWKFLSMRPAPPPKQ